MKLIERPGITGEKRIEKFNKYNEKYGVGKWNFVWQFKDRFLNFEDACLIYEDAYFIDSFRREDLWKNLFSKATDFYDNAKTNVLSGFDYLMQEAESTHIQDIAIRRVGRRREFEYGGTKLIQVRGPESEGYLLMPGTVKFHIPDFIVKPNISPEWAEENSVESFYQNNKWLVLIDN